MILKLFADFPGTENELLKTIYKIDPDHNGYVTQTEIDDIVRHIFSNKFLMGENYSIKTLDLFDLREFYKPFASSANRVLVDYKKLRDFIVPNIKRIRDKNLEYEGYSKNKPGLKKSSDFGLTSKDLKSKKKLVSTHHPTQKFRNRSDT